MKNRILLFGFAAIIAAVVFSIAACKNEPEPGPIYPDAITSVKDFGTWLGSQSGNNSTPYEVNLNNLTNNDIPGIKNVLQSNSTKYVSLNIGGSPLITSIGNEAFKGCVTLTKIVIGTSVTSIGEKAFDGCTHLTTVTFEQDSTSIGENAFPQGNGTGGDKLKTAYSTGKLGTYTRASSGDEWTKQQ